MKTPRLDAYHAAINRRLDRALRRLIVCLILTVMLGIAVYGLAGHVLWQVVTIYAACFCGWLAAGFLCKAIRMLELLQKRDSDP
jgi:high-affinity Fe2+/Pb2+ permease